MLLVELTHSVVHVLLCVYCFVDCLRGWHAAGLRVNGLLVALNWYCHVLLPNLTAKIPSLLLQGTYCSRSAFRSPLATTIRMSSTRPHPVRVLSIPPNYTLSIPSHPTQFTPPHTLVFFLFVTARTPSSPPFPSITLTRFHSTLPHPAPNSSLQVHFLESVSCCSRSAVRWVVLCARRLLSMTCTNKILTRYHPPRTPPKRSHNMDDF